MTKPTTVLILEDEPFIMLDLEMAAEERGCNPLTVTTCKQAFEHLETGARPDVAVLDVSLDKGETCLPIARELEKHGVPFVLHTGDLVGDDGKVRGIDAPVLTKPASAHDVVSAALALIESGSHADRRYAAE